MNQILNMLSRMSNMVVVNAKLIRRLDKLERLLSTVVERRQQLMKQQQSQQQHDETQ